MKPTENRTRTDLAKRIIACLDVRTNDRNDLVVTKGDQYDVREEGEVRNLGKPVGTCATLLRGGCRRNHLFKHHRLPGFSPGGYCPMLEVLKQTSRKVFVPLTIGGGIRGFLPIRTDASYSALEVGVGLLSIGC